MLKQILRFRSVLMFSLGLVLCCPGVFAQGHQEKSNAGNNKAAINRGASAQARGNGQKVGRGSRHYYHNGKWNRNGWYGWGASGAFLSNGFRVETLTPGYTTVEVNGSSYFYGNDQYFRQEPLGGYVVVTP